jgi:hypothetical protein
MHAFSQRESCQNGGNTIIATANPNGSITPNQVPALMDSRCHRPGVIDSRQKRRFVLPVTF